MVVRKESDLKKAFPPCRDLPLPAIQAMGWDQFSTDPVSIQDSGALVFQLPEKRMVLARKVLSGWKHHPDSPVVAFSLDHHARAREQAAELGVATHLKCPFPLSGLMEILSRDRDRLRLHRLLRSTQRRLRKEQRKVGIMRDISSAANSELNPDKAISIVVDLIRRILPCESWSLYLIKEELNQLVRRSVPGGKRDPGIYVGEMIPQWVVHQQETLLLNCQEGRVREFPLWDGAVGKGVRSIMCIPLRSRGRIIGVLELVNREKGVFTLEDQNLILELLEPASIAIENALLFRKAEELSITDDLTRLHNSRYLNLFLQNEVERSRRYGNQVSLIFLDLDGFKNVNDQHGHLAGSRALVEVGEVLRRTVRAIDVVSRFGGDEFTVILPQTGVEGATTIAERIRARIQEAVFLQEVGLAVRITASLGVATFPTHGENKDDLIGQADRAMYLVKAKNKNAVEVAA